MKFFKNKKEDEEEIKTQIETEFKKNVERDIDKESLNSFLTRISKGVKVKDIVREIIESPESQHKKSRKFLKFAPKFESKLENNEIEALLRTYNYWFHHFRFGKFVTENYMYSENYEMWTAQAIPVDLEGKKILDIGAADGFYSFMCENRGSMDILAIDSEQFDERQEHKVQSRRFEICKKILGSNVRYQKLSVFDLDELDEEFDIVLFFGVLYHLDNPVLALQKIFPKVKNELFLSTHILETEEPLMYLYDEFEAHKHDHTNWWVPSVEAVKTMAKRIGFKNCELVDTIAVKSPKEYASQEKFAIGKIYRVGLFKLSK